MIGEVKSKRTLNSCFYPEVVGKYPTVNVFKGILEDKVKSLCG